MKVGLCRHTQVPEPGPAGNTGSHEGQGRWTVRERPFHYLGGGLEEWFSADYFFTWCLKLDFFFTHQLKPDFFFTKNWKSDYFFIVMFQVKDIHIIFRSWGKIIFFATYQSKKIFSTYRLGQIIFFGQKQRQIIFSKTLPAPPPQIMKWSLPYNTVCDGQTHHCIRLRRRGLRLAVREVERESSQPRGLAHDHTSGNDGGARRKPAAFPYILGPEYAEFPTSFKSPSSPPGGDTTWSPREAKQKSMNATTLAEQGAAQVNSGKEMSIMSATSWNSGAFSRRLRCKMSL